MFGKPKPSKPWPSRQERVNLADQMEKDARQWDKKAKASAAEVKKLERELKTTSDPKAVKDLLRQAKASRGITSANARDQRHGAQQLRKKWWQ